MEIRIATMSEYDQVLAFYYDLIDAMRDHEYSPGWEKQVYPMDEDIQKAMEAKELYIGLVNGDIASAMVLNQNKAEGYESVAWQIEAKDNEVMMIHLLGVGLPYQKHGYAQAMVKKAIDVAKQKAIKCIRLDVMKNNIAAQKLYPTCGFKYIDTIKLFYEDTGLIDFLMYELIVKKD
ncbi:MAG: GNAT family N-acetyltransferase [Erysipelotrichaceae bacterium]